MLLFSKLNKMCFGYFDPEIFYQIMKINNFRGDLTDISAKKEALMIRAWFDGCHAGAHETQPGVLRKVTPKTTHISSYLKPLRSGSYYSIECQVLLGVANVDVDAVLL